MRFLTLLLLFVINNSVQAEIVRANAGNFVITKALTLDQLIDSAAIIFRGRVTDIDYQIVDGMNLRKITFIVIDPIKGVDDKQITLNEWASIRSPLTSPLMHKQDHVFFFHKPSKKGLTSLIGMEQGLVNIGDYDNVSYAHKVQVNDIGEAVRLKLFHRAEPRADMQTYDGLKKYCELRNNAS